MKRRILSLGVGLLGLLMGEGGAWAGDVPDAYSKDAPALAAFNGLTVVAWAGDAGVSAHAVWYSTFDGTWTTAMQIPNALTTAAPALAVADQQLYMATTPPQSGDQIQTYVWNGTSFGSASEPLCDGQSCAQTRAAPALAGDGAVLYAAWSTPTGAVRYATMINGVWSIAAQPIPNAVTSPTTGPTLAVFQHQLVVAWVDPSGEALSVAVAALPLTSSSWSERRQIAAQTSVAPALGAFTVANAPNPTEPNALFLSWTTPESTLKFARWDTQTTEWQPADSPLALPSGPLTSLAPALNGFTTETPNQECVRTNTIAYTGEAHPGEGQPRHKVTTRTSKTPCP